MYTINMLSKADMTEGHGVLSAYNEQVDLINSSLSKEFTVYINSRKHCHINHYHTINPEFLLKLPFAKFKKTKTVGYVHFLPETLEKSIRLPKPIKLIFYQYVLFFYRSMDRLVTVNPYFIDLLVNKYKIPRHKISYIPNVVSKKRFHSISSEEKKTAQKYFHIHNDRFTVLCVGQLQHRKGVLDFIETAKNMPEIDFLWAGDFSFGKISDGYEQIKKAVKTHPKNVRFLGLIDHEDMNQLYNSVQMMFLPSYEELFPMTILESMKCGMPILVRDLPIYDNILYHYPLRGKSNQEFMQIISQLSTDIGFYNEAAWRSCTCSDLYSEEKIANYWKHYYNAVLEDSPWSLT